MTEILLTQEPLQNVNLLAIDKLHPFEVRDEAGFDRIVYNFGEQQLVFKGREELPSIPGFEHVAVAGGDEKPRFTDSDTEQQYAADATKIVANQTPLGVVEAGIALGIEGDFLPTAKAEILQGVYSEGTLDLIDMIMACRIINEDGAVSEQANQHAEALVLLALSGDVSAQEEVERRRQALTLQEKKIFKHGFVDEQAVEGEPLDPDNVLLVRRTNYTPEIDQDGTVQLRATADITKGGYVRHSLHFTLDEPVVSHLAGNWDGSKYTVVDTLGNVLARRQRSPSNLASNDTWFEQNPGEDLVLPGARVFVADEAHEGAPIEKGVTTTYNPHQTDIAELVAAERHARGIEDPGDGITAHGWSTSGPKTNRLRVLAAKLHVPQGGHAYTAEMNLEQRLAAQVAAAVETNESPEERVKALFEGKLRINWEKLANDYAFVDQAGRPAERDKLTLPAEGTIGWLLYGDPWQGGPSTLNQILAASSDEARRNFYASGLSIPRLTILAGVKRRVMNVG